MKRKVNLKRVLVVLIFISLIIMVLMFMFPKKNQMIDLIGKSIDEAKNYASKNDLNLNIKEEYDSKPNDTIIFQSIEKNVEIKKHDNLDITISKGIDYETLKINELGNVPIMMYHGIINTTDNKYTGGNVDKDGYQRTKDAFINDLEFYYTSGYRMIKLNDYVKGIVDVKVGLSPIIITFDDGLENQIKVTGLDDDGNIVIDPNSAVGILESFKQKYPDFNVTATFFVNGGIFKQSEYNEKILNWLIDHGYDIGNHSYSHADFTKITKEKSSEEIGKVYNLLDKYIPGKYINIVALPFGSPYKKDHENFDSIMNSSYNNKNYTTISALRVGWESEVSPFNKNFDKTFLKRIRAYDNNGVDFDITYCFKMLEKSKYISDGDLNTIAISKEKESIINNLYDLKIVTY